MNVNTPLQQAVNDGVGLRDSAACPSTTTLTTTKEESTPVQGLPTYDDFPQDLLEVRQTRSSGRGIYVKRGAKARRGEATLVVSFSESCGSLRLPTRSNSSRNSASDNRHLHLSTSAHLCSLLAFALRAKRSSRSAWTRSAGYFSVGIVDGKGQGQRDRTTGGGRELVVWVEAMYGLSGR